MFGRVDRLDQVQESHELRLPIQHWQLRHQADGCKPPSASGHIALRGRSLGHAYGYRASVTCEPSLIANNPNWDNPILGLMEGPFKLQDGFAMPGSLGTPRYDTLIKMLVQARKQAGLTQSQVADQLGKPQSFVAKYERGERRLDIVELVDLAKVLSNYPEDLMGRIVKATL